MNPVTNPLDLRVTFLVIGMALSFLFIHSGDDKLFMPVLVWVAAGAVMSPFFFQIPCLFIIISWLLLWKIVFDAYAQNGQFFLWCSLSLWLTVLFIAISDLTSTTDQGPWFWLPCMVFTGCSLKLAHLFCFTKYFE